MSEALDRPIWHALAGRQGQFAEGGALARRFAPDVSPFAACADDTPEGLDSLKALIPEDGTVILLQAEACPAIAGTAVTLAAAGVQMVARTVEPLEGHDDVIDLGEADAAAMLALASLTKPGPFLPRTHLMGGFVGIRAGGALVAMAGERLKVPGCTEVSAVCTHPDFRGRGYGGLLSRIVATRIAKRGETAFLHAWASNTAAIRLYEALGFAHRRMVAVTVLKRA